VNIEELPVGSIAEVQVHPDPDAPWVAYQFASRLPGPGGQKRTDTSGQYWLNESGSRYLHGSVIADLAQAGRVRLLTEV
jgi:hypothetical protein